MVTTRMTSDGVPNYVRLYESGELEQRVEVALASLEQCRVCPWDCAVNRLQNQTKVCRTGRYARVASCFPHFGEEDCLRGWQGSGTIFFAWHPEQAKRYLKSPTYPQERYPELCRRTTSREVQAAFALARRGSVAF